MIKNAKVATDLARASALLAKAAAHLADGSSRLGEIDRASAPVLSHHSDPIAALAQRVARAAPAAS
jgi:hypothetical protein